MWLTRDIQLHPGRAWEVVHRHRSADASSYDDRGEPSPPSWLTSAWQHQEGSARSHSHHGLHRDRRHAQLCYRGRRSHLGRFCRMGRFPLCLHLPLYIYIFLSIYLSVSLSARSALLALLFAPTLFVPFSLPLFAPNSHLCFYLQECVCSCLSNSPLSYLDRAWPNSAWPRLA